MKKLFLLLTVLFPGFLFAQGRINNWCFEDSIGISFNGINPTLFSSAFSHVDSFDESAATISDDSDNLLFYTDGITVWNKNGDTLLNGNGLLSNPTITQGTVIITFPDSDSLVYIFHLNHA